MCQHRLHRRNAKESPHRLALEARVGFVTCRHHCRRRNAKENPTDSRLKRGWGPWRGGDDDDDDMHGLPVNSFSREIKIKMIKDAPWGSYASRAPFITSLYPYLSLVAFVNVVEGGGCNGWCWLGRVDIAELVTVTVCWPLFVSNVHVIHYIHKCRYKLMNYLI